MKRRILLTIAGLVLISSLGAVAQLDSLSLGFHLIPAVERSDAPRELGLSLSFGAVLGLDDVNSLDVMVLLDSGLTSLGASVQYNHHISANLESGGGLTILWPFSEERGLQWPILGAFLHTGVRTAFFPELVGAASLSLPVLTLANNSDGWSLLPLSELPSLALSLEVQAVEQGWAETRLTLQPVLTDTTRMSNPLGRVSDDLLVLPMGSLFLHYVPMDEL